MLIIIGTFDINHEMEAISFTWCYGETGDAVFRTLKNLEIYSQYKVVEYKFGLERGMHIKHDLGGGIKKGINSFRA